MAFVVPKTAVMIVKVQPVGFVRLTPKRTKPNQHVVGDSSQMSAGQDLHDKPEIIRAGSSSLFHHLGNVVFVTPQRQVLNSITFLSI
jgi:hypothetical protein